MCTAEDEQYDLRQLFASAMDHRAPVRVSYFKQLKRPDRAIVPGQYVKVTRVVEPFDFDVAKIGARIVRVVDRTPDGVWGPAYRAIRLDRVAFSRSTGKPLAVRLLSQGFICPTLLDGKPLHSTKRVLTARAA
jgi:hypothetical protein